MFFKIVFMVSIFKIVKGEIAGIFAIDYNKEPHSYFFTGDSWVNEVPDDELSRIATDQKVLDDIAILTLGTSLEVEDNVFITCLTNYEDEDTKSFLDSYARVLSL